MRLTCLYDYKTKQRIEQKTKQDKKKQNKTKIK